MNATANSDLPPGSVFDDPPRLLLANLRAYAIAILLHKGSITECELEATLVPHCNIDDLKVGGIDPFDEQELMGTRLQKLVTNIINELVAEETVEWSSATKRWVLTLKCPSRIVKWAIATNGMLPPPIRQYVGSDYLEEVRAQA